MLAKEREVEEDLGGQRVKGAAVERLDAVDEVVGKLDTLLVLFVVKEVHLDQDAQEQVDLGNDLLRLLLGAVLRLCVKFHLLRGAQGCALLAHGGKQALCNVARRGRGRVCFGNGSGNNFGGEAFADEGDGSQGSEGESGIKEGDGAVEQGKVALDVYVVGLGLLPSCICF